LEQQKVEANKLIHDLGFLDKCSVSIGISIEDLKEADEEADLQRSINSPTSPAYSATSPPFSPLLSEESDDGPEACHKKPKLISSHLKLMEWIIWQAKGLL